MKTRFFGAAILAIAVCFGTVSVNAGDYTDSLKEGTIDLKFAGPLAFGPEGILLVGDTLGATVYAIDTQDNSGDPNSVSINVKNIKAKIAGAVGTETSDVAINDMAVNPLSGNAYLSVSRGLGPDATGFILKVDGEGNISELSLKKVSFSSAKLPNVPGLDSKGRRGELNRTFSITDIAFVDDRVVIAGLSNEEFASNLRAILFPFDKTGTGTSVEIFHGNHGGWETRSPVRTFASITVNDEPQIIAAYTCTPLVKFPLASLKEGKKVKGVTIAELGNRNRPYDMVAYEKDGKQFLLMGNSARGTMKISTSNIGGREGITDRVNGIAGQPYDTIESLKGVVELDRLNSTHALVVIEDGSGLSLKTVDLP